MGRTLYRKDMIPIKITDVRALPGDSAFLIDDGTTAILYDSGFGFTGSRIADNIQNVLGTRPLDYIFLTHSHYDHVLGTPHIVKRYPSAKVVAGVYAHRIFQKPSARAVMGDLDAKVARQQGITHYEDLTDQLKADIAVEDGDVITCGSMRFTVVALPGHTKCSVGYYLAENKLLLGTETLGVYFGKDTYLPSFLIGYQITLDSFQKVRQMDIRQILLPHYGVAEGEEMRTYLEKSQQITIETARITRSMLQAGKTTEEILRFFTEKYYKPHVEPIYPIDAFTLNTGIMIDRVAKELP